MSDKQKKYTKIGAAISETADGIILDDAKTEILKAPSEIRKDISLNFILIITAIIAQVQWSHPYLELKVIMPRQLLHQKVMPAS